MSKMMSKVILLQLILCVVSQHLTVENGMYTNIVVEIKEDVVPSVVDCTDFLEKLEVRYFLLS